MSWANLEVMRRGLKVFEADGLDAWLEQFVAPDAVFIQDASVAVPDAGKWFGWDGWRAAVTLWTQEFGDWDIDAADRVAVRQIWHGVGSGPESSMEMTNVITVRQGRIVYQEFSWDHAEALETLGLRE